MSLGGTEDASVELDMTAQDRNNLILAGKLMIVARVSVVVVYVNVVHGGRHMADDLSRLWSLKMAVLDLMTPFLGGLRCDRPVRWLMYLVLACTFIASILSAFLECHELKLNWTLFPDAERWCASPVIMSRDEG
jgi:hypothetical protein